MSIMCITHSLAAPLSLWLSLTYTLSDSLSVRLSLFSVSLTVCLSLYLFRLSVRRCLCLFVSLTTCVSVVCLSLSVRPQWTTPLFPGRGNVVIITGSYVYVRCSAVCSILSVHIASFEP